MTDAAIEEAHRANALSDAHGEHPEFGHRCLADEARGAGSVTAGRTAWRIGRDNRWWRVFGKKRSTKKAGPPVHGGLVRLHCCDRHHGNRVTVFGQVPVWNICEPGYEPGTRTRSVGFLTTARRRSTGTRHM
ncbi:hypothetical protein AB0N16_14880 [Streptomyces sp. NPDC051105]|uniref:hypothetical protein n=1 Tax=Streptomyces sp. NPDC051105 TaxID=3154843 RepID=UPI00343EC0E3